jgi:hypothetical protein
VLLSKGQQNSKRSQVITYDRDSLQLGVLRVARGVCEIGENNGVLVGEGVRPTHKVEPCANG